MSALQESRRELMVQLEGLMRLLKVNQSSARMRWCSQAFVSANLLRRSLCLRLWKAL